MRQSGGRVCANIVLTVFVSFLAGYFNIAYGAMNSDNYQVKPDVLNEAGGSSTSANYNLWYNFGEVATGTSTSTNYQLDAGFYTRDNPVLLFSISANTVNLGLLRSSAVSTGSMSVTVSTNAVDGYAVQAYDDTSAGIVNGLVDDIRKVADATTPNVFVALPSAGTEHYGITVTGSHANAGYTGGTKINSLDNTTRADIGSYGGFITGDQLDIQYRASISNTTPAATAYRAITTFICTANY